MAGVALPLIEGIEDSTALVLLSQIGTDRNRWASAKKVCRWLGLAPQPQLSGGKLLARRVRPGSSRATAALRLAARSLHHAQRALGAFFRRINARRGTPKAIGATAHKLARLIYRLLKHGSAYVSPGMEAYEAPYRQRQLKAMTHPARALGDTLGPVAAAQG
jgi:hypothetical protein